MRFLPIGDGLAHHQIFEFDLRIAVLAFFECLEAVRCKGLLRTCMHTCEADGAVVAGDGCLLISGG